MVEEVIENTLYYGYYPNSDRRGIHPEITDGLNDTHSINRSENLIEEGIHALETSMDLIYESVGSDVTHIVPLSGGLDSRVVLGLLLERTDPGQIMSVSFGVPGTWDYEIGQDVARETSVSNIAIDLRPGKFDWSEEKILEYAASLDYPNRIFEGFVNEFSRSQVHRSDTDTPVFWNGFLGEALAGEHLGHIDPELKSWKTACSDFVTWNRTGDVNLTSDSFDPINVLPSKPFVESDVLSYADQLDLAVRQRCFIEPLVRPSGEIHTPFLKGEWASFILNVPYSERMGRRLFKNIIYEMFPDLFSLPTETNRGLPLFPNWYRNRLQYYVEGAKYLKRRLTDDFAVKPYHQYIDFGRAFRGENQLSELVMNLVTDFADRKITPWMDPIEFWNSHQAGDADYNYELRKLASIELFLQSR